MSPQEPEAQRHRHAIPTLGTELQSKQAPQKLRAWGDGGKKLSLPLPPTTGDGLDPWGATSLPGSGASTMPSTTTNGRLSHLTNRDPSKGNREGAGPSLFTYQSSGGATGLEGRLVS